MEFAVLRTSEQFISSSGGIRNSQWRYLSLVLLLHPNLFIPLKFQLLMASCFWIFKLFIHTKLNTSASHTIYNGSKKYFSAQLNEIWNNLVSEGCLEGCGLFLVHLHINVFFSRAFFYLRPYIEFLTMVS